jgi:hypothetical protein
MGQGRGCPITLTAPVRAPFPWFPRFQARNQLVQDSNSVIALKTKNDKIGSLSHGAAFHEEIMKIGFVSLLGNSRFPYATLFYVMTSILGILALFGHFFTSKPPPVTRRGLQTCGSCRVGRLSPIALRPN